MLADDIEKIGERVEAYLTRRVTQTAFTFLKKRPDVFVGNLSGSLQPARQGRGAW